MKRAPTHQDGSGAARAAEIVDANAELVAFIRTCSNEEWRHLCSAEGWTVGVVAHHIAWGHEVVTGWIQTIRAGHDVPGSPEAHDAGNHAMAAQVAGISRDQVIELAARNIVKYADLLHSLTEDDLAKTAAFGPGGGMPMPVARLAGSRRHLDGHLSSMRAAVGR